MSAFEQAVIEELLHGKIVSFDLPANGICEVSVRVSGKLVNVTWYNHIWFGDRSIEIDGKGYPASGSGITHAAKKRAKTLIYEHMTELDEAVK